MSPSSIIRSEIVCARPELVDAGRHERRGEEPAQATRDGICSRMGFEHAKASRGADRRAERGEVAYEARRRGSSAR
jgi:hypothetical protein